MLTGRLGRLYQRPEWAAAYDKHLSTVWSVQALTALVEAEAIIQMLDR